jgi:glycosyltransferase involved in cell wall biosynthesis
MPPPRITLAVLAYNQSQFIDTAVRSALAQVGEPIEILLSDDCSPDDTLVRMQALADAYRGPHQVRVRCNERNLGIGAHYNELMRAARGELVVLMAGDDISLPERVQATAQAWDATAGRADLVACDLIDMDAQGVDHGALTVDDLVRWTSVHDWAQRRPYIVGAGHAVTRRLFERFGPLADGVAHEDQVNLLRALCGGGGVTVRRPLLRYRRGGVSDRTREFSVEVFLRTAQRQNAKHLALHQQWLSDAHLGGCEAVVAQGIRPEHGREVFLRDLLAADSLGARWRASRTAPQLELGWRLRKLCYWQWPGLAVTVLRWQAASHRLRHGDSR